MEMIRVLVDERIGARHYIFAVHALEVRTGNCMPEMADDGVDEKQFAIFIPIHPPRICRPVADSLDDAARGMITPDAAAQFHAFGVGRAGSSNVRMAGDADAAIKPAVRSPAQAVGERVMAVVRGGKTVEQYLRFAVGHIIAVAISDEKELRRAEQKHTTETRLDTGELLRLVEKNFASIEVTIVVLVFQNQNAVAQLQVEESSRFGVGVILRNPQPAARVECHRDGLAHIRLAGESRDRKSRWHLPTRGGFGGGQGQIGAGLGVMRRGKLGRTGQLAKAGGEAR
jgi:hypothetical protein